jgi:GT2 family glycosyltransferase
MKNKSQSSTIGSTAKLANIQTISAPVSRWMGAIEGIHRGLLYGWAIDTEHADARVVLEVHLNDSTVCCVIADVARNDLNDFFIQYYPSDLAYDCCHGFIADLGQIMQQDSDGKSVFILKVANTNITLPGHIEQFSEKKPSLGATSFVFSDGALRLHGWAIDYQNEKSPLTINALLGKEKIAETIANLNHPSLRISRVDGHGFNLDLPMSLADGQKHQVRIVDGQGREINGSPITVCCYANGVETLLPSVENSLIQNVLRTYEQYLPRSIGVNFYPEWATQFEVFQSESKVQSKKTPLHLRISNVTVVVYPPLDVMPSSEKNNNNKEKKINNADILLSKASLKKLGLKDIQIITPEGNDGGGIKFDSLLEQAIISDGEFIACIRAGDELAPHAFTTVLDAFQSEQINLVYSDSTYKNNAWFKPAWNFEYAVGSDYPLELLVIRKSIILDYLKSNQTPQNYATLAWGLLVDAVRSAQKNKKNQYETSILHVPRVLYQFNSPLSFIEQASRTTAAAEALKKIERRASLHEIKNLPIESSFQMRRLQRKLSTQDKQKKVSLIIPTRNHLKLLEACIASIQKFTKWPELEIIVIDNGSSDTDIKKYFKKIKSQGVHVLSMPGPFNFADLNNRAIDFATGEIIGLINNDIEALHDGWLDEIISHLMQPNVGIVGAKLLWPNGMVQHGGVLLGLGNVAGHFGNRLSDADLGDHGRNQLVQQVSAVTAACLFIRKKDYLAVSGMDTAAFPVAFNDLDLCLKIRQTGKVIIWTPNARLLHAESASRGLEDTPQKKARSQREINNLRERWGDVLLNDPNYHPSLNLDAHSQPFNGLALPPRNREPRDANLFGKRKKELVTINSDGEV